MPNSLLASPAELKVVNGGIDTFLVNYKFVDAHGRLTGDVLPDEIATTLDEWQQEARKDHEPVPTELVFKYWIDEQWFEETLFIRPHGSGVWSWLLYSDSVKVSLSHGTLNKGLFCQARFSSHLLWSIGPENAVVQLEAMLDGFVGCSFHEQASEIHLCADVQGFDFSHLSLIAGQVPFVSRVNRIRERPIEPTEEEQEGGLSQQDYHKLEERIQETSGDRFCQPMIETNHRRVATIDFGSHASKVSAQIYNKSLEIKKHKKAWFEDIWRAHGWDGESEVWRIEFRFKRDFLHDFELDDAFDVLGKLFLLWQYATGEWLRFVDLSASEDTNTSRLPTHPVWEVIQQAFMQPETVARNEALEREMRIKQMVNDKPLQVIKQGQMLLLSEELQHLPEQERLSRLRDEYQGLEELLGLDEQGEQQVERDVLRSMADEEIQKLLPEQVNRLCDLLSPDNYQDVQALLIRRSRRIARLEMYIAASAGYLRSAVALAAEETGEVSSLTGKVVRQPDLLSDLFWLGGCIRDYDRKKNRSYAEEVLKKRLKFNMVTAQTLDEERRLHGVDLVDKDWDVIRDTFKDMFGKSKRPGHADSGSHDEIA